MKLATLSHVFFAPLMYAQHKLVQSLAAPKHTHTSCVDRNTPRPASSYAMLVESDIQRGVQGILP